MCSVDTDMSSVSFLFHDYLPHALQLERIYNMLTLILSQAFHQYVAIKGLCLRKCWGQIQSALYSDKHFLHYHHTNCPALLKATLYWLRLCKGGKDEKNSGCRSEAVYE